MRAKEVFEDRPLGKTAAAISGDIALVEMSNLPPEDTGVQGIIYISSAQGKHGARIKWYPAPPKSRNAPCLSVSIGPNPTVRNLNLPQRVVSPVEDQVKQWVILNHTSFLDFWNNGYSWTRPQVNAFIESLKKV